VQGLVSRSGQSAGIRCIPHGNLQFNQNVRGYRVVGDPSVPGRNACRGQGAYGLSLAGRIPQFKGFRKFEGKIPFPHQFLCDGRRLHSIRR
jgi:hypothetical protein